MPFKNEIRGGLYLIAAFTFLYVVMVATAKAEEPWTNVVCPSTSDFQYGDGSRCHTIEPGKQVNLVLNSGLPSDIMAEVCDPNGKDCYTGYVKAGSFGTK